jgi:hypothetical protein
MNILEIQFPKTSGAQPLEFRGRQIGTLEGLRSRNLGDGDDLLHISFDGVADLKLPWAVDISQQLKLPRVLVIEENPLDSFALFGGERMYWVTDKGTLLHEISLFRQLDATEYWTTEVVEDGRGIVITYDAGVLALGEDLRVRWHRKKFFNDVFVGLDGDILKFVQDHDTPWSMRADDGAEIA